MGFMMIAAMLETVERLRNEDPLVRSAFEAFPSPEQRVAALSLALLMMENDRNIHRAALDEKIANEINAASQTKTEGE